MMRRAVLVSEKDIRLGTVDVWETCQIICYGGAFFVRTDKVVKLRPAHTSHALVFDQTEVYARERLGPV